MALIVVNAFAAGEKFVLGMDAGVFGLAKGLRPYGDELEPRSASKSAMEPIVELTEAQEAAL